MGFVHSRILQYKSRGHEVDVLSFSATDEYCYEGVRVVTCGSINNLTSYSIVVSHAPNLKNHIRFLLKFSNLPVVFVIHGHEVLIKSKYYPIPFDFEVNYLYFIKLLINNVYDYVKVLLIKQFIKYEIQKGRIIKFIFVSEWMREECLNCVKIPTSWMLSNSEIIPNPVNQAFLVKHYHKPSSPLADVICIRPFDDPKYAIDIVMKWAIANPNKSFHIIGKGKYFDYNDIPDNVKIVSDYVPQFKIPELLDHYLMCAMPTRLDAQGVMMCEMASYGIPLFTSDLAVIEENLGKFPNVTQIPIHSMPNLDIIPPSLKDDEPIRYKFDSIGTVDRELNLFSYCIKII